MLDLPVTFLLLSLVSSGFSGDSNADYVVYVGPRSAPFIAYGPPQSDSRRASLEPPQVSRVELPTTLCGATVLRPDLLMTSVRCSPSSSSKAVLYVFPETARDQLFAWSSKAQVIRGGVRSISFKSEYQPDAGETYSNVALVQLSQPYFNSASRFNVTRW